MADTETDTDVVEAPEQEIARDIARRGLYLAPVIVLVSGLVWGWGGAVSAAIALGVVIVNFLIGAWMMAWTMRRWPLLLMGTVLGGYVIRLGIVIGVFYALRFFDWFENVPYAITILVSHIALLAWETRHVSISLAYPGLQPPPRS